MFRQFVSGAAHDSSKVQQLQKRKDAVAQLLEGLENQSMKWTGDFSG